VIVHVPTGSAELEKLRLLSPAAGAKVPPQVFVALGGFATTRLPG